MVMLDLIKTLRQETGLGVMDCKRALEEAGGDLKRAQELLKEKGLASAVKRVDRETREGLVEAYIHTGGRLGALVEIGCETDFVARTEDLKQLAHDLAMQIAAMPSTAYVDRTEIEEGEEVRPEEAVLLEQSFIKDPSRTVGDMLQETIAKVGENVRGQALRQVRSGRVAGRGRRVWISVQKGAPQAQRRVAKGRSPLRHRPRGGPVRSRADQRGRVLTR